MRVTITTQLNCPPGRAWQEVQTSRLLRYVTAPLVAFKPVEPPSFPEVWREEKYLVGMRLFGLLPVGRQWIVIGIVTADSTQGSQRYQLRDNGHGDVISTWDHWITIEEAADGTTLYTDDVEVKAGVLTPFVWAYANTFYRYRQVRWRQLVKRKFTYNEPTKAT